MERRAIPRRAYVICAQWPVADLTILGQVSWLFTGGGDGHVGIFIPFCTAQEKVAHNNDVVAKLPIRGADHVCFDYLYDLYARFHTPQHVEYWGERGFFTLHPILCAGAHEIHAMCVAAAEAKPYNSTGARLPAIFGGTVPCHATKVQEGVGLSSCGGLTMRIIASAVHGTTEPLRDDALTFRTIGVDQCGAGAPLSPWTLTGFTPRAALEAMQGAQATNGRPVLGPFVLGFEGAIARERRNGLGVGHEIIHR